MEKLSRGPGQATLARPTVSILMCNYNHAQYLPDSLGTISRQTHAPDEVIIVDDGSTDQSLDILEDFRRGYPCAILLRNETNRGLMYSIHQALALASKDYIVWLSADDKLLPRFLERNLAFLTRHPRAGVCFSRLAVFADGSDTVREYLGDAETGPAFDLGPEPHYLAPDSLKTRLARSYLWMSGNTVLARRDAVLAAGGFRPELKWHSEWFVFYVVALRHGACVLPETLALIRERPQTYSRAGMSDPIQQAAVLKALAAAITDPQYRDVAPVFRARPALLSPFGILMLRVLLRRPTYWDLGWRYLHWSLIHWARVYRARAAAGGTAAWRKASWATVLAAAARVVGALTPRAWID